MTFREYMQFVLIFILLCGFVLFFYKQWKIGDYRFEDNYWD